MDVREPRRVVLDDGSYISYSGPLTTDASVVEVADLAGRTHRIPRERISEITLETGAGAHPDDDEVADAAGAADGEH